MTKEQKSEERKKLFGFFKRKEKPAETTKTEVEEVTEEKLEQLDQIIKSDSGEVIPEKFSAGKEQFEPDFKKIKEIKEDQELEEVEKAKEVEAKGTETKETEEKKGFFSKVKQTLTTKTISEAKFEDLFWNLEIVLLENNVSVEVIEKIKDDLKEELVDKPLPRDVESKIEETLAKTLKNILSFKRIDLLQKAKEKRDTEKKPLIIAFFGINGSGKTTSIAKLTNYFQRNGLSVVLAACDTFRAAAIQQLEEHADKLNVKMIKHDYGSDAAAVAFDSVKYAEKNKVDVVLIDTAGRLHSNTNLMAELEKIIRVVKPDLKIFIGESITGNDCIEQARKFNELVEMDGAILTKADVDEKGGAPLSIAYTIKKPILFLGVGQEYKDLEEFDANLILKRLGF
ncbi:signal recognition particle-docking protein FtsY [Candidatus Woesearchaeota archaeon CG_4_10_14_0_2_um_filter_33_13]|nr:MAG: signal recognition particle-docking protein FtsY [Candidatus Woesearchaeota archaeon CG_4_10_14_0_2_um_filter_33_13]